jgi:hypothetical protein
MLLSDIRSFLNFGLNCLILLQKWTFFVKIKIVKRIMKMRRLLEVEEIKRKVVLRKIDSIFCNLYK